MLFKYGFDIILHTITMVVQYVLCNSIKFHPNVSYRSKDSATLQENHVLLLKSSL